MKVIPFKTSHLVTINKSGTQYMEAYDCSHLEGKLSFTAVEGDVVLLCAGVIEVWEGRFLAWALASTDAKGHWKSLHKETKRFFNNLNARRVEADIECDFAAGKRWAEKIGFKCELEKRIGYFPDGRDASLYSLIGK